MAKKEKKTKEEIEILKRVSELKETIFKPRLEIALKSTICFFHNDESGNAAAFGSGVLMEYKGEFYIVTAAHVLAENYTKLFVILDDKELVIGGILYIQYIEDGFPKFHIDFAVYSDGNTDTKTYIAKGTPTISKDQVKWEISEPKRLKELINGKYTDSLDKSQFIRSIRYFKRWKDNKFDSVNGKPTGIALTALAYNGFKPYTNEYFNGQENIQDLKALIDFTNYIIGQFSWTRIEVKLPVPPYNDLFEKMTDDQCKTFKEKLQKLKETLVAAQSEPDPHEACKILKKEFGDDFPVPPKEETAQNRKRAVVGTNESA